MRPKTLTQNSWTWSGKTSSGLLRSTSVSLIACHDRLHLIVLLLYRSAFLTKLDVNGDTNPGIWERFNRAIDKVSFRNNERANNNDAATR